MTTKASRSYGLPMGVTRRGVMATMLAGVLALVLAGWWWHRLSDGRAGHPLCDSSGRHLDGLQRPAVADLAEEMSDVRLCVWGPPAPEAYNAPMVLERQRLLTVAEARKVLQTVRRAGPWSPDCVNADGGERRAYTLVLSLDGTPTWRVWVQGGACPGMGLKDAGRDPRQVLRVLARLG